MNKNVKDWEIARAMFGKNTKVECKIVKVLRKHGEIIPLCDEWSIIYDKREEDTCGLIISNEYI